MGVVEKAKLLTVVLLAIYASITVRVVHSKDYKLGVLLPYSDNIVGNLESVIYSGTYYAAAITLAIDKVNNDPKLLPGSKLSFVWNNTQCNQTKMVEQQHWQIKQGVSAFIGPACHGRKATKIAAKHDLAVISFGCQSPRLSDKRLYPNFARISPGNYKAVGKILALLEAKKWKRVSIMYQPDRFWKILKKHLIRQLSGKNITVGRKIKLDQDDLGNKIAEMAIDSGSEATIFLLPFDKTREIMAILESLKPLDKRPRYGFMTMLLDRVYVKSAVELPFKWFFSAYHYYSVERTERTKAALKKLFVVTIKPDHDDTVGFKSFKDQLKMRTSQKPFYSDVYQGCAYFWNGVCLFNKTKSKPPYAGAYLYDAVIQFAEALHDITQAGEKPSGVKIVNQLKEKHFTGIDGHKHQFDKNANVKYDFSILKLKKDDNDKLNMLPIDIRNEIL